MHVTPPASPSPPSSVPPDIADKIQVILRRHRFDADSAIGELVRLEWFLESYDRYNSEMADLTPILGDFYYLEHLSRSLNVQWPEDARGLLKLMRQAPFAVRACAKTLILQQAEIDASRKELVRTGSGNSILKFGNQDYVFEFFRQLFEARWESVWFSKIAGRILGVRTAEELFNEDEIAYRDRIYQWALETNRLITNIGLLVRNTKQGGAYYLDLVSSMARHK